MCISLLRPELKDNKNKLNKASFLSWLIFASRFLEQGLSQRSFKQFFEIANKTLDEKHPTIVIPHIVSNFINSVSGAYIDRASSRVADPSSVILRDMCLWVLYVLIFGSEELPTELRALEEECYYISNNIDKLQDSSLTTLVIKHNWGEKV
jgi:hypothetical protein